MRANSAKLPFLVVITILYIGLARAVLQAPVPNDGAETRSEPVTAAFSAENELVETGAQAAQQGIFDLLKSTQKPNPNQPHPADHRPQDGQHHVSTAPAIHPHWELDPLKMKMEAEVKNLEASF